MKALLFERGRGVANNAATDSHVERMTVVMRSVGLAPQIFFRLSDGKIVKALSRLYGRSLISLSTTLAFCISHPSSRRSFERVS